MDSLVDPAESPTTATGTHHRSSRGGVRGRTFKEHYVFPYAYPLFTDGVPTRAYGAGVIASDGVEEVVALQGDPRVYST